MSILTTVILVALVVAGLGWLLRRFSGGTEDAGGPPPRAAGGVEAPEHDILAELDAAPDEVVAVTSDGWAFVPDGDEVQLVPPGDPDDVVPVRSAIQTGFQPTTDPDSPVLAGYGAPVNPKTGRRVTGWKPGEHLDPGDLIAARVRRGSPDHDPWRLEALGRDHEYRAWRFETEEAARAAHTLVERRIVRPPRDEDGNPDPPDEAEFAAAKRREEEIEAELASMPDTEAGLEDRPR